jgi:CheY-like chemotaxis protein
MTIASEAERDPERKLVVIVDDEPGVCETLRDVFEDEGYEVSTATDGRLALELLRGLHRQPCVVLLDLAMPVLDGSAVYTAMKGDPKLRDIAVVITTSDPTNAPAGCLMMKKPINLSVLLATVRRCCND